jgi:hypothetical protein
MHMPYTEEKILREENPLTPGRADSINNGANDNASGVAGLRELALWSPRVVVCRGRVPLRPTVLRYQGVKTVPYQAYTSSMCSTGVL